MEGGKNFRLGHPMSIHGVLTVANATLMGHRISGANPGSPTQLVPLISAIVPVGGTARYPLEK